MKLKKTVLIFAKEKPGVSKAISYLEDNFTSVKVYKGNVGDPIPQEALLQDMDICISYISPWIIPAAILERAKEFAINFHPGPPEYPGIGCTNFALYNEEAEFGVTVHHMAPKVDTGVIIDQKRFPIHPDDTVYSLTQKCYENIQSLFYKTLDYYKQNESLPKEAKFQWQRKPYMRKDLNDLCRLNPDMTQEEIKKRIRATTYPGMPGAFIELAGERFERKQ